MRFSSTSRIVCAVSVALCLTGNGGCNTASRTPRDVVVVGKGMTFVVEGDASTPNPVIQLRAGERVRLVLKNEAPGLLHDFQIPAWRVQTEQIRAGQTAEVSFTVPAALGRYQYLCRPHSELMHGFIEVVR
jgi:plastocyanin